MLMLAGMVIRMHAGCIVMHRRRVVRVALVPGVVRHSVPDVYAWRPDR